MTDTPDHTSNGTPDDDLRALVRAAGAPAGIDFRADLRARLAAAIDGDVELEPRRPGRSTPGWFPAAAAAAVLALLVGAIVLLARGPAPDEPPVADGTAEADLIGRLVGPTWVAIDVGRGVDLPTLAFKVGTTRPEVLIVSGNADCNDMSGELQLDGDTVAQADLMSSAMGCPYDNIVALPATGATLRIVGSVLSITNGTVVTEYVAIDTLPVAPLAPLDGTWRVGADTVTIAAGQVVTDAPTLGSEVVAEALRGRPTIQVIDDDRLLLGSRPTELGPGRFLRLDRLTFPSSADAPSTTVPTTTAPSPLDQIVGRIWVGVDGPWRTASPTLVFDSLDRDPGLWAVSAFDGCNAGSITFRLDGNTMATTEGGLSEAACEHTVAGLADGTTLALDGGTLTVAAGAVTTMYVALDSLALVDGPDLDGAWVIAGAEFSITGDSAQTAQGSEDLTAAVGRGIAAEPVAAWPYGLGWILGTGDAYLQLAPSDLPYGVDPVVTTGELEVGEAALITGTVVLERGCLVVREGDLRWPIVWQPGTAWDRSIGQVVLPGGVFLARGTRIEAGGGYHPLADLTFFGVDAEGIETITRCADLVGDEIAVIQSPVSPGPPNPSG